MKIYPLAKRLLDLVCIIPALILICLPMVIIAVIIRLSGKGPAIFKQQRSGKNAIPFTLYKFRTMRIDVDPFGASPKSEKDLRLTKIGVFLREYSLDELPQLLNILKGDMSLVGPRPLYVAQIAEWNDRQKRRLEVKPGLTGLAQISGRGELTIEEKLEYDVQYVEQASLGLDLKIICKTFTQVFSKQAIYEKKYSENQHTRGE